MSGRIVVNLEPFDRQQSVIVFLKTEGEKENIETVTKVPLEEIPKTVTNLCDFYHLKEVTLCGCGAMLSKTQEDIYKITSFDNKEDISVTIVER